MNLSDNALLDLSATFRSDGVNVEPGLKKDLYESNMLLKEFFEVRNMDMEVKSNNEIVMQSKPVVICKDIQNFVEFVKAERKVTKPVLLRYGADGGGMYQNYNLSEFVEKFFEIFQETSLKSVSILLRKKNTKH